MIALINMKPRGSWDALSLLSLLLNTVLFKQNRHNIALREKIEQPCDALRRTANLMVTRPRPDEKEKTA